MLQCRDGRLRGIIPACAGNTGGFTWRVYLEGDHPRVCGEHDTRGIRRLHNSGSSPRVRGTRCAPSKPVHLTGIIPACAGNTYPAWCHLRIMRDHPRVCGEHKPRRRQPTARPGSSPRVRGTRALAEVAVDEQGIIPACAGNTTIQQTSAVRHRGSSPRVRGTRGFVLRDACRVGIIPACAGNTAEFATWVQANRDHPRVCGEHTSVTYPSKRQ